MYNTNTIANLQLWGVRLVLFSIFSDFTRYIDANYGACYTFNKQIPPKYTSSRAGPARQEEYISTAHSAGVRVLVHAQNHTPFVDAFGYNAGVGFATTFAIQYLETYRKDAPHGNCTHQELGHNTDYFYEGDYLTEGCFRSCVQQAIMDACSCADPHYFIPQNTSVCTVQQISCSKYFTHGEENENGTVEKFDYIGECEHCTQPCRESLYSASASSAQWPSIVYKPSGCNTILNETLDNETCISWYKENSLIIEVYYERMNYHVFTETPAYTSVQLISDIGGQLGLWMGFSVVTVIEFMALLIIIILYYTAGRNLKLKQTEGPPNECYFDGSTTAPAAQIVTPVPSRRVIFGGDSRARNTASAASYSEHINDDSMTAARVS